MYVHVYTCVHVGMCMCMCIFLRGSVHAQVLYTTLTFPLRVAFSAVSFFFITATGRAAMTFVLS